MARGIQPCRLFCDHRDRMQFLTRLDRVTHAARLLERQHWSPDTLLP